MCLFCLPKRGSSLKAATPFHKRIYLIPLLEFVYFIFRFPVIRVTQISVKQQIVEFNYPQQFHMVATVNTYYNILRVLQVTVLTFGEGLK